MKDSKNKQKRSPRKYNSEDFYEDIREGAKKLGILEYLDETPLEPTNEYTITFAPFAGKHNEKKKSQRKVCKGDQKCCRQNKKTK